MKKQNKKRKQTLAQLIREWDRKLAESGFNDIEDRASGLLKKSAGTISIEESLKKDVPLLSPEGQYSSSVWKDSQASYFRLAGIYLHTKEFKSQNHKTIWELHAAGRSNPEIAKELRQTVRQIKYAINCMQQAFRLRLSRLDKSEEANGSDHVTESAHSNSKSPTRRL